MSTKKEGGKPGKGHVLETKCRKYFREERVIHWVKCPARSSEMRTENSSVGLEVWRSPVALRRQFQRSDEGVGDGMGRQRLDQWVHVRLSRIFAKKDCREK